MASTAHQTEKEIEEHFDDPSVLERKLDQLAEWVRSSEYVTAFTGAGISTSAGIPDFRGPDGVWTRTARGDSVVHGRDFLVARPTVGHMAVLGLWKHGILRSLLSTNTDGLHLRSGFPRDSLTELHGNTNLEECPTEPVGASEAPYGGDGCGSEFFRDERVRAEGLTAHQHATGRMCENCGKPLQDTVINFHENLRRRNVEKGLKEATSCDLMLCLGSSLRVSTWAPEQVARDRKKRLVIVNLQWTPLDGSADLKINARTDTVLTGLCTRLNVNVVPWQIQRQIVITTAQTNPEYLTLKQLKAEWMKVSGGKGFLLDKQEICAGLSTAWADKGIDHRMLVVRATDASGKVPYAFLQHLELVVDGHAFEGSAAELKSLQHNAFLPIGSLKHFSECCLTIHTPGRYGEPPVTIKRTLSANDDVPYTLIFSENQWTVMRVDRHDDLRATYNHVVCQEVCAPTPEQGFSEPDPHAKHPWSDCLFQVIGFSECDREYVRVQDFVEASASYWVRIEGNNQRNDDFLIPAANLRVLGPGEVVRVEQLVDNQDLNGRLARVIEFVAAKGRYTVDVDGGRRVLLPNRCLRQYVGGA